MKGYLYFLAFDFEKWLNMVEFDFLQNIKTDDFTGNDYTKDPLKFHVCKNQFFVGVCQEKCVKAK